jgi:protein O-mannosyl-transferase
MSRASRAARVSRPEPSAPRPARPARGTPRTPDRAGLLAYALIAIAAFLAYANTFNSPFVFDDLPRIVRNALVQHPWPPWRAMTQTSRPIVQLSFALNHAISGLQTWSYHLVNVGIHAINGMLLFALIRRTLARSAACARYRSSAQGIALTASLLWTVHPLATEAVTYVVQRSESLASLFYLLVLVAIARGADSKRAALWNALALVACVCGMASKPVMASAPFVALLYDRTFLAGSFRRALATRGWTHGGLFASLLLLPVLLAAAPMDWRYSSVSGAQGIGALDYAKTQPGVVLHYLRLALWPSGLTLDYDWPIARDSLGVLLPAAAIAVLAIASIALLARANAVGFLGAFVLLVLAPTSSVIPILDMAFEHRMYLALAAVVLGFVLAGRELLRSLARSLAWNAMIERRASTMATAVLAVGLGAVTVARNADYRSAVAIWSDTAAKRPQNPRPRVNLAYAIADRDGIERGLAAAETAVARHPDYPWGHLASGYFLIKLGRADQAIPRLRLAASRLPASAEAHYLLGSALSEVGAYGQAIPELETAIGLEPWRAEAENNLGAAHLHRGAWDAAITHLERAVELSPGYTNARFNLATAYGSRGDVERARRELEATLAIDPDYEPARRLLKAHDAEMRAAAAKDSTRARTVRAPR